MSRRFAGTPAAISKSDFQEHCASMQLNEPSLQCLLDQSWLPLVLRYRYELWTEVVESWLIVIRRELV